MLWFAVFVLSGLLNTAEGTTVSPNERTTVGTGKLSTDTLIIGNITISNSTLTNSTTTGNIGTFTTVPSLGPKFEGNEIVTTGPSNDTLAGNFTTVERTNLAGEVTSAQPLISKKEDVIIIVIKSPGNSTENGTIDSSIEGTKGPSIVEGTKGPSIDGTPKPSISKNKPKLVSNFSSGGMVVGVGTIYDDTFVLHEGSSSITVFDRDFAPKMNLELNQLVTPYEMVVAGFLETIFVLDTSDKSTMFRIRSDRRFDTSRWLFSEANASLSSLSITPERYILITDLGSPKLKEFLANGVMLKVVTLNTPDVPLHAVKIATNLYAVSFGKNSTEKHQVCIFTDKGELVGKCYGGEAGSGEGQLHTPIRLLFTDRQTILVADYTNNRIIELDANLTYVKTLLGPEDGVSHPARIVLDKWRGLLFVGVNEVENEMVKSGKVVVYRI